MTWLRKVKDWIQDQRGVGLVESLVAVAILGISVVAFVMALSSGTVAVREGNQQVVVQSLVRTQLEYVKGYPYIKNDPYDPKTIFYPLLEDLDTQGYNMSVEVGYVSETYFDTDIQKIEVIISRGGPPPILTVEDYKVNR